MEYGSDEDVTESSIFDLDNAPPPPSSQTSPGGRFTRSSRETRSPRPPRTTRKNLSLPHGGDGGGDLFGLAPSMPPPPSRDASARPSVPRGGLELLGGLPHHHNHHHHRHRHTAPSGAGGVAPPHRRPRAYSHSSSPAAAAPPFAPVSAAFRLSHVRSFPPDGKLESIPDRKAVAFDDQGDTSLMGGKRRISGVEEVKEEEQPKEITLDGSEIDQVKSGIDSPKTDPESQFEADEWTAADDDEGGSDAEDLDSIATVPPRPVVVCGFELPMWFAKRRISWNRVATFVVDKAPCFLCRRMKHGTHRSVLVRLNVMCAFFALAQLMAAVWFYIVIRNHAIVDRSIATVTPHEIDNQSNFEVITNVWNLNGPVFFLGMVALVVLIAIAVTARAIQNVNLAGAIRFLWMILWVIPLQIFWTIGLFDYFGVTKVWIKFSWRDKTMAWFRRRFCYPAESANELCTVPVFVEGYMETEWCQTKYNSTSCVGIRDSAQIEMERFIYGFYYTYAAWTMCFIILLFLVVKTLENIISRPLFQKSKESNIPSWLLLPIIGSFTVGSLYGYSTTSVLSTRTETPGAWIGPLFITAGGLFSAAALLAWFLRAYSILNTRDKRRKSIAALGLIMTSASLIIILTSVFSASITFSLSLEKKPIGSDVRGNIACFIDQSGSCTGCENADAPNRCPEWSQVDVTKIIQSQAKAGASLAAIFLIYASGCLRYGFTMRTYISDYMIDYV